MYTACYMPGSPEVKDKSGFRSQKKAWQWIKENHLCDGCLKKLDDGGAWYSGNDKDGNEIKEWLSIKHVGVTPCGGEWGVVLTKNLENCETFEDFMEAADWEPIYRRQDA